MCGRENPAELEVCQFCQARLKPLNLSLPAEDEAPQTADGIQPQEEASEPEPLIVDWLRDMRDEEETSSSSPEDLEGNGEEQPLDWLDGIRLDEESDSESGPGTENEDDFPGGETEPVEEEPEWLERIRSRKAEDWAEAEVVEEASEPLPDLFEEGEEDVPVTGSSAEQLPDWLADIHLGEGMDLQDEQETPADIAEPAPEPGQEPVIESTEAHDETVVDMASSEATGPGSAPSLEAKRDEELPEEGGMPAWYDEFRPEEPAEDLEIEDAETDADLTPAQIPVWLEGVRPVESVAPSPPLRDETERKVESSGPLAGLRGVLPAEMELSHLEKPLAYPAKIQATENQSKYADLLRSFLEEEGRPRPLGGTSSHPSQAPLRWVIAAVLFLAILWSLISGSNPAPLPPFPQESQAVHRLISAIPAEAKVLLAFDYDPGLSPEMDATAAAVVDHLMLRGAHLTLISTLQAGPLVAERFITRIQDAHGYQKNEQYVNLGFIPGGAAGLLSLAESPARTVPFTLDSVRAWESGTTQSLPPLQGIRTLEDFSMVVVIADQGDLARAWIEQVAPSLDGEDGQTPMVMVVSAQAEPLVRPYYQGNPPQIQGLVSGLRGGAGYASLTGRESLPNLYWPAFGTGLVVATLLVVGGGAFNLSSGWLANRKNRDGEER